MNARLRIALCAASLAALPAAAPVSAQERGLEEEEAELAELESALAAHYRGELASALATDDLHAAGLALKAWASHHAMAARAMEGVLLDEALHARIALHARALAVEGRMPEDLEQDLRALDEERERLSRLPDRLTRA